MRQKLTAAFVMDPPKPSKGREVYWDTAQPGFGLRVTSTGHKSFVVQYRAGGGRSGKDRLATISATLKLDDARKEAKKVQGDAARGLDPVEAKRKERDAESLTVRAILEDYLATRFGMTRDAEGKATFSGDKRSGPEQLATFERYVYPKLGKIQIDDLKRSTITTMLDGVAKNGEVMADRTLSYLRAGLNWYAARTDDWVSPIVRGMARTQSKERAGTRVLADDEIRDLWTALDLAGKSVPSCYPRYVRALLLTAVRRNEASEMPWTEVETINRDDFSGTVWTVAAARMKNKDDHAVPVTEAIAALFGERPRDIKAGPYVFSTTGGRSLAWAKPRRRLKKRLRSCVGKKGAHRWRHGSCTI